MIPGILSILYKNIKGTIHVGAHRAEEMNIYLALGSEKILWYDANPELCSMISNVIQNDTRQEIKNKAVSNFCGEVEFNIEQVNDGHSSSILDLKLHKQYYPDINYSHKIKVDCVTLDSENLSGYNFLATDAQGSDLNILIGAENLIRRDINYIYTEVFTEELYEGCGLLNQVDDYLNKLNFHRVYLSDTSYGWGDAFYIKKL